jgi:predicted O-linked N-acetylglucosamine transferase (SPINDLY family)
MATISEVLALAVQHHQRGRLQAAEQLYRQVLQAEPEHADALHLLGVLAHQFGKHEEAVDFIAQAIRLKGNVAAFHCNLGGAYQSLQRTSEAVACYHAALKLKPDYAQAAYNLGNAMKDRGILDEAAAWYRRAVKLQPNYVQAHNNLGNALQELEKLDEALVCFRRALELQPDYAEAHNNLGAIFMAQGKPDDAAACFRRARELQPDYAEAHNNLGQALKDQGQLDEAAACFRRALEMKPCDAAALGSLLHTLQHVCCWEDLEVLSRQAIEIVVRDAGRDAGLPMRPFTFLALPAIATAEQQLRCARRWADRLRKTVKGLGRSLARDRRPARGSKIAVAYLSADFHDHATAQLVAEMIEKHDRRRLAVSGYSLGPDDNSPMRRRLVEAFDHFVDIKETPFKSAAERIAADGVDILVDLKGYTKDCRTEILALRPAPIQVNYLGFPGTMGAEFIDYILVDDYVVPSDQQPFFSEKLVHLPGCYQVNPSQREISPRRPTREECGLPSEGFVFCSFNNSYKITPPMFGVWMRLLGAVPGSVLWLLEGNRVATGNLRREAEARGVAAERLVFAPRLPLPEHMARHGLADLFLDTFPVNAHTTASDALRAGLPVVTLAGQTFISRVAGSLLRTIGLPELIATSLEDYEALALRLARDPRAPGAPGRLADLRVRLENNRTACGLFDGRRFARNLESAYATMWEIHASGEKPRGFAVSPTRQRLEYRTCLRKRM